MATNNAINNLVAGVGIQVSDYTASTIIANKGDLLVGNGTNSATTLSVGTDTYCLIADSAESTGIKYTASQPAVQQLSRAFGYGNSLTSYVISVTQVQGGSGTASSMTANTLYCLPFNITISTTFSLIGLRVNSTSSNTIRLGIYDATGTGGYPGALVLDAGTVSSASTTGEKTISISQTLHGNYWLALISSGTPSINIGGQTTCCDFVVGVSGTSGSLQMSALTEASVGSYFTALPASLASDTFTYSSASSSAYLMFLKV